MTISGNGARRNHITREADPGAAPLSVSPVTLPFQKGEILAQKYRVESLIGVGGIGFVIAAAHVELGERLALKFLRQEFVTHPEAVRRFASEARHAARIRSEHVARVFDVGALPDGSPFIVMEYLEGTDLHQLLYGEGPLSVERAVGYVLEACEALAAAHACHVVHRDIKPDNLFLAKQLHGGEILKVLDFGISKAELDATLHDRGAAVAKQTLGALGSPSYMAPEQIRSAADVDGRADIWSLGCVLYELLTMTHAFDAPSLMQVCAAVLESHPAPLESHRPDLPAELAAVVLRCLEKDPARRYQDMGALAVALEPFGPPRALASIEKTVEMVKKTRPYAAEEPPPSSRIVRSYPANDRPLLEDSAVRPLPHDGAQREASSSEAVPPPSRTPSGLLPRSEPSGARGRLQTLAPPKSASARTAKLELLPPDRWTATPPAARLVARAVSSEPITAPTDENESASKDAAGDPSAGIDAADDDEPTRIFSKPLTETATTPEAAPDTDEPTREKPAVAKDAHRSIGGEVTPTEPSRSRSPEPVDTTPSVIIQSFPEPRPLLDTFPEASSSARRSLAPLWIALALATACIVVVEWRVWWPARRHRREAATPLSTTAVVGPSARPRAASPAGAFGRASPDVERRPRRDVEPAAPSGAFDDVERRPRRDVEPAAPSGAFGDVERAAPGRAGGFSANGGARAHRTPRNEPDAPRGEGDERNATKALREASFRVDVGRQPWRLRHRTPNAPKIEAIAEEVTLASDDDRAAAAPSEPAATAAPSREASRETGPSSSTGTESSAATNRTREAVANTPSMATARMPAAFPASAVARVVRDHASEIQACYDRAAMDHPDLEGRITLHAVVDEHGAVVRASASSIEDGARLSACIADRARRWRFAEPPSGATPISYTFVFE